MKPIHIIVKYYCDNYCHCLSGPTSTPEPTVAAATNNSSDDSVNSTSTEQSTSMALTPDGPELLDTRTQMLAIKLSIAVIIIIVFTLTVVAVIFAAIISYRRKNNCG